MNNEKGSKEKVVKPGKGKGVEAQQKKLVDLQKKYDEVSQDKEYLAIALLQFLLH